MNLEKLINSQILICEIKRKLEAEGHRPAPVEVDGVPYGPCLLLSRECGSDGERVAHLVGEKLRWHVFNREIVGEIARYAHVRQQLIESVDEDFRSRWRHASSLVRTREEFGPESFLHYLHEIVLALGHHGDVVIVGRGAQFLLPSKAALRVRIVAPLEFRIRQTMKAQEMSLDEAARLVRTSDENRTLFIQRTFHQDANSPLNYDVVLNMAEMSSEAAARVVLSAMEEKLGITQTEPAPCAK